MNMVKLSIFEYEEFTMESLLAQQHHFVEIFGIIDGQLVNTLQQTIINQICHIHLYKNIYIKIN